MRSNILGQYQLTKKEFMIMWLNNYEFCEPIRGITTWTKYHSIDEFAQRLVMCNEKEEDEYFRFRLNLDETEEMALQEYLLKNKSFVVKYILNRESFSPDTHLYQLYLQYLSHKLNEVEANLLLDGYIHMLATLQGNDYAAAKRLCIEKRLKIA